MDFEIVHLLNNRFSFILEDNKKNLKLVNKISKEDIFSLKIGVYNSLRVYINPLKEKYNCIEFENTNFISKENEEKFKLENFHVLCCVRKNLLEDFLSKYICENSKIKQNLGTLPFLIFYEDLDYYYHVKMFFKTSSEIKNEKEYLNWSSKIEIILDRETYKKPKRFFDRFYVQYLPNYWFYIPEKIVYENSNNFICLQFIENIYKDIVEKNLNREL